MAITQGWIRIVRHGNFMVNEDILSMVLERIACTTTQHLQPLNINGQFLPQANGFVMMMITATCQPEIFGKSMFVETLSQRTVSEMKLTQLHPGSEYLTHTQSLIPLPISVKKELRPWPIFMKNAHLAYLLDSCECCRNNLNSEVI